MQAIILAAGMGRRLKELTRNNTKCMVKVNNMTLIERMLRQIEVHRLKRIIIVIGYKGNKLKTYVESLGIETPVIFITNEEYSRTNNIYSLALAKEYMKEDDTLLFESDLIFEDSILDELLSDERGSLALVDKYESWMDGTCVTLSENDTIKTFVPKNSFSFAEKEEYYKTVNIYKFSRDFSNRYYIPFLEAYQKALGQNEYYEQVLRVIAMLDEPAIQARRLNGQKWYEIDDIQDLDIAESMFVTDEDRRVELLQKRYGGYWRYPRLLDFCYLVNPYFPPQRLLDEIKANFETLVTSYPSGISVNSLLAAKNHGVRQERILVGNGAAELIKSMMTSFTGKLGIVRPTFEEYSHRYFNGEVVCFWPDNPDFSYDENDVMSFFDKNPIDNLVIINPDNPSGNYIKREGLLRLISWTKDRGIRFVLDESFADFADEEDNSLMVNDLLQENPHLYVVKSISKSYGVPGLRLGIMASGDEEYVAELKKDVAIWNINSLSEYYLQIEEKYSDDYIMALSRFRKERKVFLEELKRVEGLRAVPSQANYIMAEVTSGMSAKELTRLLIINNNILIKNLAPKIAMNGRQYIRLAVRNREEDQALVRALNAIRN